MNRKALTKFAIFIAALMILIPVGLIGFALLTRFISAFQQGADPASIFHGHQLIIPSPDIAQWLPFTDETERPTRAEQEEIISAYVEAWDAIGRAHQTGDISDLATYWAGAAYYQISESIDPKRRLGQTHKNHRLRLSFMSSDGSVVTFRDNDFIIEQALNKTPLTLQASAVVVMTLDQGFWRVRSIRFEYQTTSKT